MTVANPSANHALYLPAVATAFARGAGSSIYKHTVEKQPKAIVSRPMGHVRLSSATPILMCLGLWQQQRGAQHSAPLRN
jgi:hypothetical protein